MSRKGIHYMNKQRLAIVVAAGIGMLCTFLPWASIPFIGSINGTRGDGWITLLFFAVPLAIGLLTGQKSEEVDGVKLWASMGFALISGIIAIYKIVDFNSKMSNLSDNPFAKAISSTVSVEWGLYLLALTGIALPALAWFLRGRNN